MTAALIWGCGLPTSTGGAGLPIPPGGIVAGTTATSPGSGPALAAQISAAAGAIQDQDPTGDPAALTLPKDLTVRGDRMMLAPGASVITDAGSQLAPLADTALVALQNATGFDMYVRFAVDGAEQGLLIYSGQSLLIQYPCPETIVLLSEDLFELGTGQFVSSYDLLQTTFVGQADFQCGDLLVIPFLTDGLLGNAQAQALQS